MKTPNHNKQIPLHGTPNHSEIETAVEPSMEVHPAPEKSYYDAPIQEKAPRLKRRNRLTPSNRFERIDSLVQLDHEMVNLGRRIRSIREKVDRKTLSFYKEYFQKNASPNARAALSAIQKQGQVLKRMETEVNGLQGAWERVVEVCDLPFVEERCACGRENLGTEQEGNVTEGSSGFSCGSVCGPYEAIEDSRSEESCSEGVCYGETASDAVPETPNRKAAGRDDKAPEKSC